jgi:hypothetical protein
MKSKLLRVQLLQPLGLRWLLNNTNNEIKNAASVDHAEIRITAIDSCQHAATRRDWRRAAETEK